MDLIQPQPDSIDPADYVMENTQYHDCYLTVGDPKTDYVEVIGVAKIYLLSQSLVFRNMLESSDLADPSGSNTHITDISPDIFKIMLRHMYGGTVKMSLVEAEKVFMSSDKYNIKGLFRKAVARLMPSSDIDIFPALRCVAYVHAPPLLFQVNKVLESYSQKMIDSKEFVKVDGNVLLFIVTRRVMDISEPKLWGSLVSWASARSTDPIEQRKLLKKHIPHIRFLSFHINNIVKYVIPTQILEPDAIVDILDAIGNKKKCTRNGICGLRIPRKPIPWSSKND